MFNGTPFTVENFLKAELVEVDFDLRLFGRILEGEKPYHSNVKVFLGRDTYHFVPTVTGRVTIS